MSVFFPSCPHAKQNIIFLSSFYSLAREAAERQAKIMIIITIKAMSIF